MNGDFIMAIDPTTTQSNFISNYRKSVNELLDARESLKGFRELAATRDYPNSINDSAFSGINKDLGRDDIAAVFTAMDNLEMILTDFTQTPPTPTVNAAALLKMRQ